MNAEIIAVGTELLLGDIINTNARHLSRELAALGINVFYQTAVGDNESRLLEALRIAFSRSDIVITTGGLGPTADDLTKEAAARYFGKEMVLDIQTLERIKEYFDKRGQGSMPENNTKQAYNPNGSHILPNSNGTAPGCLMEENGKILVMLPGPPGEAWPMFEESVQPYLRTKTNEVFLSRMLRIAGLGESKMELMVKDIIEGQADGISPAVVTVAPYARDAECALRVTARAMDKETANALIEPVVAKIRQRLGDYIYAESDDTCLAEVVINMLRSRGMRLAVAESCTGGMLTSGLVDVAGASDVLAEAVITYSNESKIKRLGVRSETIEKYGAVSAQTAEEMAAGAARWDGADVAVSVTGIAGPGGGTDEKPVGLVYIGLCIKGEVCSKELRLAGNRSKIRLRSVIYALDYIRRELMERGS